MAVACLEVTNQSRVPDINKSNKCSLNPEAPAKSSDLIRSRISVLELSINANEHDSDSARGQTPGDVPQFIEYVWLIRYVSPSCLSWGSSNIPGKS